MASLAEFVTQALVNAKQEDIDKCVNVLEGLGVTSREECSYVTKEDLAEHLTTIQIRKFLSFCEKGDFSNIPPSMPTTDFRKIHGAKNFTEQQLDEKELFPRQKPDTQFVPTITTQRVTAYEHSDKYQTMTASNCKSSFIDQPHQKQDLVTKQGSGVGGLDMMPIDETSLPLSNTLTEELLELQKKFGMSIIIIPNTESQTNSESAEKDDLNHLSKRFGDREDQSSGNNIGTHRTVVAGELKHRQKESNNLKPTKKNDVCSTNFEDIIRRLNLQLFFPNNMHMSDVLLITKLSLDLKESTVEEELSLHYLYKLTMLDYTARNVICKKNQQANTSFSAQGKSVGFGGFLNAASKESSKGSSLTEHIHPMDIHMSVYHCADNFLRQYLFLKMSACQYAVPILVPSLKDESIEMPLWCLRQIKRSSNAGSKSRSVVSIKVPIVSFMRFGKSSTSKSQIMNKVINKKEHNIFFHRHCKGSCANRVLMDGVAEIAWYCPSGKQDETFNSCIAFINLHGDAWNHPKQVQFLQKISSVNIIVLPKSPLSDAEQKIVETMYGSSTPLICLMADNEDVAGLHEGTNVIIPVKNLNEADLTEEIVFCIRNFTATIAKTQSLGEFAQIGRTDYGLKVDEDCRDCQQGKEIAEVLVSVLKEHPLMTVKENLLPLSGKLWHEWCQKDKELYRLKGKSDMGIEEQKSQIILAKKKKVPTATLR